MYTMLMQTKTRCYLGILNMRYVLKLCMGKVYINVKSDSVEMKFYAKRHSEHEARCEMLHEK
jgi:hypothetical protein